jgi:precorrin-2 dehydrogenase/sirohydrochlorin ferrochelatase
VSVRRSVPYYPIALDLDGRPVVIVGGGAVSARKIESLLHSGAHVTVVAPDPVEEIAAWAERGELVLARRPYQSADVDGATLVIAATSVRAVNEQIARDCRARAIPVNVVDDPSLCDFLVPAVLERGSIQLTISTGGKSPAFARRIKRDLENALGPEYAEVNDILGSLREAAKQSPALPTDPDRKRFFEALLGLGLLEMIRDGRSEEAYAAVATLCQEYDVALSELVRSRLTA